VQTAFRNWAIYGHVFGTNEIMGMMLDRDLLVLLISDGIICGSTGFGWIVQKLVFKGYLSWNKQGWIIQNVSLRDSLAYKLD
jgi:sterol O-acyltransferase